VIYKVCVTVVVHRHEFVRLYGDPAHRRIYIYKKDAETHYDPLLPILAASDTSDAPLVTEVSDGAEPAASAPVPDGDQHPPPPPPGFSWYGGVWWCMVVHVGVWRCQMEMTMLKPCQAPPHHQ
jgi:hypothetical protein